MGEFERSLKNVLVHEGGYVNHPKDPGGATNYGVTQRVYDSYRSKIGQAKRSVRQITFEERDNIYREQYWEPIHGDELPVGVSYVVFDGAVNSGVSQSVKWLQRALGEYYTGAIDGALGIGTLAAVQSYPDYARLVEEICDRRLAFLKSLKTWSTFGKGWAARVRGVRVAGKAWASNAPDVNILHHEGGDVKATVADAKRAPSKAMADASSGAGSLTVVLSQSVEQLTPLSNYPAIGNIVAVLTVLGVLLTIGGFAYRAYAKSREEELADALDLRGA